MLETAMFVNRQSGLESWRLADVAAKETTTTLLFCFLEDLSATAKHVMCHQSSAASYCTYAGSTQKSWSTNFYSARKPHPKAIVYAQGIKNSWYVKGRCYLELSHMRSSRQ